MKKIFLIFLSIIINLSSYAEIYQGAISEKSKLDKNNQIYPIGRITDKVSGKGVGGAKIYIPKQHYQTKTDKDGYFELDTSIDETTIMSVQKDKYKPFSITVDKKSFNKPLILGIEKSDTASLSIDSNMYHLGDNSYSDLSANAGEFRNESLGPFYTKKFNIKNIDTRKPIYLVIGSIIGIDTYMARSIGQNRNPNSYASPPEIFFNGNKISEIQINGDGQKIRIPNNLIKRVNEVTIKTGRNLMQTSYVDYDDIEFMNLMIEN